MYGGFSFYDCLGKGDWRKNAGDTNFRDMIAYDDLCII